LNACSVLAGEDSESAALGVECVLRKVRDERQCAATRLARFRYALSNRTRGRFSAFSPCRREATGSLLENGAAKNAYNRAHSFRGFDGSVSVCLDLLDLPFPSAHSRALARAFGVATQPALRNAARFCGACSSPAGTGMPQLPQIPPVRMTILQYHHSGGSAGPHGLDQPCGGGGGRSENSPCNENHTFGILLAYQGKRRNLKPLCPYLNER
jgi:hypothetical protein